MSNYNMDDQFSKDLKLTFKELFEEIYKTNPDQLTGHDEISFAKVFHNIDNTGINDNLKKHLNFDIGAFAKQGAFEKYNMIRLQKLLFTLTHIGVEKVNPLNEEREEFTEPGIFSILGKPYYNNLNTIFDNKKKKPNEHYGDSLDYLIRQLRIGMGKDKAGMVEERYGEIESKWKFSVCNMFEFNYNKKYNINANELDRIKNCIQVNLIDKLESYSIPNCSTWGGVFQSFYSILMCHIILCYEADLIENKYSVLDIHPEEGYINNFKELSYRCDTSTSGDNLAMKFEKLLTDLKFTTVVSLKEAVDILEMGLSKDKSDLCQYIWDMITYYKPMPFSDKRTLDSKIEKFKKAYLYLRQYKSDEYQRLYGENRNSFNYIDSNEEGKSIDSFESEFYTDEDDEDDEDEEDSEDLTLNLQHISLLDLILIMQEVIYIDSDEGQFDRKVISKYYRCGSKWNKSAKSIYGETNDPVVVQSWAIRLENRYAVNMGQRDIILIKRDIDLMLYRLKQVIFLNRQPMDAELSLYFISSKLFDIRITDAQMKEHLLILNQVIKHIPRLSYISDIEFLEENKQALRRLTQFILKNYLKSYFDFWAKVALELPRHKHEPVREADQCENLNDYICIFEHRFSLALEENEPHVDRSYKKTFEFTVDVKVSENTVDRTFTFKCKFDSVERKLSVLDYSEEMDYDSQCRLEEIGLGNLLD